MNKFSKANILAYFRKFITLAKKHKYISIFVLSIIPSLFVLNSGEQMFMAAIATFLLFFVILVFWNFTRNIAGGIIAGLLTIVVLTILFATVLYLIIRANNGDIYAQFNVFEIIEDILKFY